MIIPATAKPRFSLLPDFLSFEREIWPKIEPINEKKPAVRNNVANEVIKEAIASPLPDFASCSAWLNGADRKFWPGVNSDTLSLVNYNCFDPVVAKSAAIFRKVEDDFNNDPGKKCNSESEISCNTHCHRHKKFTYRHVSPCDN
jgi:hypothetical protein